MAINRLELCRCKVGIKHLEYYIQELKPYPEGICKEFIKNFPAFVKCIFNLGIG